MKPFASALVLSVMLAAGASASDGCGYDRFASMYKSSLSFVRLPPINETIEKDAEDNVDDETVAERSYGLPEGVWDEIKGAYRDGDCILYFESSPESWKELRGVAGYVLVRDGQPVHTIVTKRN